MLVQSKFNMGPTRLEIIEMQCLEVDDGNVGDGSGGSSVVLLSYGF